MEKKGLFGCSFDLDERQLLLRGNVYQHSLALVLALLLINGFLKDCGITWAQGMWENILIFWAGAGLGMAEFILRDINPRNRRMDILYITMGICSVVLLVLGAINVFAERRSLMEDGMLNHLGAGLIQAVVMLGLGVLFLGKRVYDKRHMGEE